MTLSASLAPLLTALGLSEDTPPTPEQWQALLGHLQGTGPAHPAHPEQDSVAGGVADDSGQPDAAPPGPAQPHSGLMPMFSTDAQGILTTWHPAAQEALGHGPEVLGKPLTALLASALGQLRLRLLLHEVATLREPTDAELLLRHSDGLVRRVIFRLSPLAGDSPTDTDEPLAPGVAFAGHLPLAEPLQATLNSANFYEEIFNALPASVALFDAEQRYVFCNPASIQDPQMRQWIVGRDNTEFAQARGFAPDIAKHRQQYFEQAIREGRTVHFEEMLLGHDGDLSHQHRSYTPVFAPDGTLLLGIGHGTDITALKRTQEALTRLNNELEERVRARTAELEEATRQLGHAAFHDPLTGLPNRAYFIERLEQAIARTAPARPDTPQQEQVGRRGPGQQPATYAVLFLDTDRFKGINDTLGHLAGDDLLRELARRLQQVLRSTDLVARFGGDEFAVLIEPLDRPERAIQVAQRIQYALGQPMPLHHLEVSTSASIGIVLGNAHYDSAQDTLRDADIAMYRAKAAGRAGYQVFTPEMRQETLATNRLENDLRLALGRGELRVLYQSIVRLSDLKVTGFEALVRWQHPERGLLGPGEFLPVAQETGLLLEIDRWVLREACAQMGRWQQSNSFGPMELSVNFSGQHFTVPGIVEMIADTLRDTGLPPHLLNIEITEGVLLASPQTIGRSIEQLRDLGVRMHLDDFGTGYSSLGYLQSYPLDTLKIDRSFIGGMIDNTSSAELVRTIVAMAKNMKMCAVAEGIETAEQLRVLRDLGCEYGQGFLFSNPLDRSQTHLFLSGDPLPLQLNSHL